MQTPHADLAAIALAKGVSLHVGGTQVFLRQQKVLSSQTMDKNLVDWQMVLLFMLLTSIFSERKINTRAPRARRNVLMTILWFQGQL